MKRFDIAIKCLREELHRQAGKVAIEYAEKGVPMKLVAKRKVVMNIKEAIDILNEHSRNKHV